MKLALIYTAIEPHAMNFAYCMDIVGCEFSHIPLPLATIAALTPDDVEITIIDENIEPVPENIDADIIGFSSILCQKERTFEYARKFRAQGKTVVVGGALVDDQPDECREIMDVVFKGEAEYTWPKFIEEYRQGKHADFYEQKEWVDVKDSPIPRFDLLKTEKYSAGCVQITRGCPYRCEYCDVPTKNGGFPRSKTIENALEEIRLLSEAGYDSIFIVDDHFAGNRKFAKDLLRAIANFLPSLPIKMYFYTQVSLNVAKDEELLQLFHDASFRRLFIGIETSDSEQLTNINKKHNIEQDIMDSIRTIQSYGITVWAGILFGLDGDSEASYEKQFQFIMESGVTPVQMGLLQAMPDTPLYDRIIDEGRLIELPQIMGASGLGDNKKVPASNISPSSMGEYERDRLFAKTLKRLYAPDAYATRILDAEARIKCRAIKVWPDLTWKNISIVGRAVGYYLFKADWQSKRMFFRMMGNFLIGKATNLEELLFNLVIYKHLRTFYFNLADSIIANQEANRNENISDQS